jgi:hypothetical protein
VGELGFEPPVGPGLWLEGVNCSLRKNLEQSVGRAFVVRSAIDYVLDSPFPEKTRQIVVGIPPAAHLQSHRPQRSVQRAPRRDHGR